MGLRRLSHPPERVGPETGSVSLELIGTLPVLLAAVLVAAQIGVAGYALWAAANASRAGARAVLTGRAPRPAAEHSLPPVMRAGLQVSGRDPVRVGVRIPRLVPLLPATTVRASASLGEG